MLDLIVLFGFVDKEDILLPIIFVGVVFGVLFAVVGILLNRSSNVNQPQTNSQPQPDRVMFLEGIGGRLDVYDNKIIVARSGAASFLLHDLKENKTLYYYFIRFSFDIFRRIGI
jgi:hypothetical protein